MTPQAFAADLATIPAMDDLTVRICSGGGDVWAAQAIGAMLENRLGTVTAQIEGICASAATIVASHCKVVKAAEDATYMIHPIKVNPNGFVDMEGLKQLMDALTVMRTNVLNQYAKKTGHTVEEVAAWMDATSWWTAAEAKENGFIVKIKVNGASKDFIVVQQGNPNTSTYDSSCAGTWLLMKDIYTTSTFGNDNSYKDSSIHSYLNSTFFNLIDADIRNAIKQVKIPYQNGTGSGGSLATGSNGLSTKVFLLSGYEVGWTTSDNGYFPKDGVRLAYFGNSSGGNSKRIAYNGSSAAIWWLRSPYTGNNNGVCLVYTDGSYGYGWYNGSYGVRPAFILPSTLVVSDDGTVSVNTAPTVSTDGAALGKKNTAFAWKYTVRDADGDTLTVTEKLDGKTTKTRTGVASGTALTFEQAADAAGFQRVLNGRHTLTVEVSDGKETTSASATFTKAVHAASVTLAEPLTVEGDITVAVLQVTGSIPDDAKFKAEVTNNALDSSPVWQDATTEAKKGVNIVFENKTATNGAAFNFRVSVERGESGEGGYIEAVSGAFQ